MRQHLTPDREIVRPYSWYILDIRIAFEVNSRYSNCILLEFLDARTVFGSHPVSTLDCIRATFDALSNQRYSGSDRTAVVWSSRLHPEVAESAFWTLWQHSKYFYCVRTTFKMHSRANTLGMCKNHSMRVRSEFLVFVRHSKKIYFYDISPRMWLEFWKLFIPAGSASFRLSVTGALVSSGLLSLWYEKNSPQNRIWPDLSS